jgi:hypothetical protein
MGSVAAWSAYAGCRDVAQLGSALDWGSRGRRFKSCRPDRVKRIQRRASLVAKGGRRAVDSNADSNTLVAGGSTASCKITCSARVRGTRITYLDRPAPFNDLVTQARDPDVATVTIAALQGKPLRVVQVE